jgi:phosphatidylglycerol---prolipoprotein diacylglyceryl transferase
MEPMLAYFHHDFSPFLIRFGDNLGIRYYGLAYVMGFVVAGLLLHLYYRRGRSPLNQNAQYDLLFWIILGTMLGGRLGYFLFYDIRELLANPLVFFKVWDGGMASHGGFIGVIAGTWWAARKNKLPFLHVGDLVATLAPPGLFFGRIANFINGELWGKVTTVPWAWYFPHAIDADGLVRPRHPSQLYEAALEGLLMMAYTQWRLWRTPVLKNAPGQLAGEFLIGYAIVRVVGEFFRQNDEGVLPVLGLNRGAWLSLGLIVAGVAVIIHARRRAGKAQP